MAYFTYILKSENHNRFYIGSTQNLESRLRRHNLGGSIWTKNFRPWKLIHFEQFDSRSQAVKRESEIKRYKGGNSFKELIKANGQSHPA